MPVHEKAAKEKAAKEKAEVTFALAVVKSSVISDRAESSRIEAALQLMFPGVSFILVAEDADDAEGDGLARYRYRRDLSDFMNQVSCRVVPSSKITTN
jgi:hypothetical protein